MDALKSGSSLSMIVFVVIALVVLYYAYQFLYSPSDLVGTVVLPQISPANTDTPYEVSTKSSGSNKLTLPEIYEGGEFSINTWVYINDYAINRGQNKHVLNLGGSSFSTLAIFLGPYKNSLGVRVQTSTPSSSSSYSGSQDNLSTNSLQTMFTTLQTESSLLNSSKSCDIQSIELQKWVQVSVILNNKTCDVYLDGKLARSCVLPSFFRVDKNNMKLSMCNYKGFGGFISNTSAYNYALNPEQVWRLYMAGPGVQYSLWQYITSLFNPKQAMSFDYPKQNIIG
jgi:hypothetical protein